MTTDTGTHIPLFHRAHYNIIAAQIQRQYAVVISNRYDGMDIEQRSLEDLALNLAKRLKQDNPHRFDPVAFLNDCSPNIDLYPLGELWRDND